MLTGGLVVLGWIVIAGVVARVVARLLRAGATRERSLPSDRGERIKWIRGDEMGDEAVPDAKPQERQFARRSPVSQRR